MILVWLQLYLRRDLARFFESNYVSVASKKTCQDAFNSAREKNTQLSKLFWPYNFKTESKWDEKAAHHRSQSKCSKPPCRNKKSIYQNQKPRKCKANNYIPNSIRNPVIFLRNRITVGEDTHIRQ